MNHQLQTIRTNKVSLSCSDEKRYIIGDGITCLPSAQNAIRDKAHIGDYHLYLKTDTLLLAFVVAEFRRVCYATYKLNSTQYPSRSQLSVNAFLPTGKADLCLFTGREDLDMVGNMIHGELSCFRETSV